MSHNLDLGWNDVVSSRLAHKPLTKGAFPLMLFWRLMLMSVNFPVPQVPSVVTENGGAITFATDDFFAVAENLLKADEPEWRAGEYTEFGKWMDGWETRRKRKPGHDFCIIKMAAPAVVTRIEVNTAFFTGNHAPTISIQAAEDLGSLKTSTRLSQMGSAASEEDIQQANVTESWETILEPVSLKPGYPETQHNVFPISSKKIWQYLRLNLFPDGGIARLRVFGAVVPPIMERNKTIDLAAFLNGGEFVSFSNAHFGHPRNLISPTNGINMADGWETARRLDRTKILKKLPNGLLNHTGYEWCIIKLGFPGVISHIIIDTHHFKGNYPDQAQIEATDDIESGTWDVVLPFSKISGHQEESFVVSQKKIYKYIKLTIQPDGGVSRLRIFGVPSN